MANFTHMDITLYLYNIIISLEYHVNRVAEVGVLAATAKYPSVLARSTRLQFFATKNTVFYNCKFLQHKHRFFALALTALR